MKITAITSAIWTRAPRLKTNNPSSHKTKRIIPIINKIPTLPPFLFIGATPCSHRAAHAAILESKFCSQNHDVCRIVYPDEQDNNRGDRTIDKLVISEVLKVENEKSPGDFEKDSGQERSWPNITPVCPGVRNEFIE